MQNAEVVGAHLLAGAKALMDKHRSSATCAGAG